MKKNIIKILSDSKVEQYPEIPVVGWIDNGDQFYKISGIIDLLYKYKNEWFILDYKTDGDKSNLEKYKIQIQTYQWIVKQLFNIDAKGEIYFSALGEFISIDWNDEYFSKISDSGKRYSFTKHSGKMDLENIIEIIEQNKDEDILIINYTKYQSEIMKRQLSNDNLLSPKIRIKNLNEIIREQKVEKKRLSPSLSHLAVRKIVGEKEKRGTVKLLRDAIIENEKCDKMIVEFSDLKVVEEFEKIKAEKNLITNSDVLKIFSQSYNFSDTVVILNGIFEIDEEKFVLFKEINKGAKKFYFIDNFDNNSIKNNFNYDVSIWDKKVLLPTVKSSQNCKICYSVNEEVMELANDIMEIQNWKSKIDDMKIAVSSMDRYLPIMKKVFDEYGIPLRLITGKSLIENPIAQFIFDVIKLMQSQENWIDVREVILSPFIDDNEKYFEFDKWVRNSGIEKYYKIEERVPDNMKSLFSEIDNLLKEKF
ncbi:MAG: PD-(D/E)XK nuclease family protein, partial [Candidatus Marinimicrobia bacterium]|nr:PD-(D/E)XK nuclease family protein [Candidatus Neomarinimicrobiota bacterium]